MLYDFLLLQCIFDFAFKWSNKSLTDKQFETITVEVNIVVFLREKSCMSSNILYWSFYKTFFYNIVLYFIRQEHRYF